MQSSRLDLVCLTKAFMRSCLDGDRTRAEAEMNLVLPAEWPDAASLDWLEMRLTQAEENEECIPWLVRAMVLRQGARKGAARPMIGFIGFHAEPGDECLEDWGPGSVEIGYTVFSAYRRRGYTFEASQVLMDWAYADHGVTRFVACIGPENEASREVAAKLGFVAVGRHMDEINGIEDVYVREIREDHWA